MICQIISIAVEKDHAVFYLHVNYKDFDKIKENVHYLAFFFFLKNNAHLHK